MRAGVCERDYSVTVLYAVEGGRRGKGAVIGNRRRIAQSAQVSDQEITYQNRPGSIFRRFCQSSYNGLQCSVQIFAIKGSNDRCR